MTPAQTRSDSRGLVELSIEIPATADAIWRVLVDTELSERWLGGFRMVSTWTVGGPFTITGQLNGDQHAETGTLLAIEAPTLLRWQHWSSLWRVPDLPEHRAVMTVRLTPESDLTRVSLTHELPAVEAIVPHSRFFWTVSLDQLRKLVLATHA